MSLLSRIIKANRDADIRSSQLIMKSEGNSIFCEQIVHSSPIYRSLSLRLHYKLVFGFSFARILTVRLLISLQRQVKKIPAGNKAPDAHEWNISLQEELMFAHFELKKEILDDAITNLTNNSYDLHFLKKSIHSTLFRQYKSKLLWLVGFFLGK